MYVQKCLELWSSGTETVRLAAFLAIRRLAMSPDESTLDTILKVRSLQNFNQLLFEWSCSSFLVNLFDISSFADIYQCVYIAFNYTDEKFCIGCVLSRPCYSVSTCFWLYPTARNSPQE